jgi:hypothetical protein
MFVNMLRYSFRLHHCNFAISEADLPCGLFADTGRMGRGNLVSKESNGRNYAPP